MSRTEPNPLEYVLRLIAAMAPRPWYPRMFARDYGVSLDDLNDCLKILWNEGLVVKADSGSASTGAGLQLSLSGMRLLDNPEGLRRLAADRAGVPRRPSDLRWRPEERVPAQPLSTSPAGKKVRAALAHPIKPIATFILLGLNVAVFCLGLALTAAWGGSGAAFDFFVGPNLFIGANLFIEPSAFVGPRDEEGQPVQTVQTTRTAQTVQEAWHATGSVTVADLQAGQWWRLLSCCFVHFGILHIGMNMYVLSIAGRNGEVIWGWWRFLLIYLLAGLGGSVLAMTLVTQQTNLAGASGALCGILAAELIWVLLNGRHLPRDMASEWRRSLLINAVLITFVSLPGLGSFGQVSWEGHLGGALVGAAVAVILNVQRFASASWRWAVLLLLLLLPLGGWLLIARARTHNKVWEATEPKAAQTGAAEERDFENRSRSRSDNVRRVALTLPETIRRHAVRPTPP